MVFKKNLKPSNASSNKTWTLPLNASNTLTIVENRLKMGKLQPPRVKGVKNSTKQTTKHYKG
jgi:hypothetical protein